MIDQDDSDENVEDSYWKHSHKFTIVRHIHSNECSRCYLNTLLHNIDQNIPTTIRTMFIVFSFTCTNFSNFVINIARKTGRMQYPNIATDWKNDTSPPRTRTLKLTMVAPTKTEKNKNRKSDESTLFFHYCWWRCRKSSTWRKDPINPSFVVCTNFHLILEWARTKIYNTLTLTQSIKCHIVLHPVYSSEFVTAFRKEFLSWRYCRVLLPHR